jgi:hypothetical protein
MKQVRLFRVSSNRLEQDSVTKRIFLPMVLVAAVALAALVRGALWAANDPFVGEWKLNPSKSKLIDQMKVESVGGNKYAFDFGGGPEAIAVDSTDQPGAGGTTLSVTAEAPDAWKLVRKKDGRVLITGNWKLSKDGNTLTDDFTFFPRNGSPASNVKYTYRRTAGTSGFAGTWEGTSDTVNAVIVVKVQPYEEDGLSFVNPSEEETTNVKFDGKEYPNVGPNVSPGSVSSARRVNASALEITDKFNGKVTGTRQVQLSSDRKTLTITVHTPGRREPNILVFERQ